MKHIVNFGAALLAAPIFLSLMMFGAVEDAINGRLGRGGSFTNPMDEILYLSGGMAELLVVVIGLVAFWAFLLLLLVLWLIRGALKRRKESGRPRNDASKELLFDMSKALVISFSLLFGGFVIALGALGQTAATIPEENKLTAYFMLTLASVIFTPGLLIVRKRLQGYRIVREDILNPTN